MEVGLRIDVDTFRGTKLGVPNLCKLLAEHSIQASFFFSVGPDNMGRHLWRLLRPAFFIKMLRTKAASLYGWSIVLRGTLWPGPIIGKKLEHIIQSTGDDGHEIGLHAWDHHCWQAHIDTMNKERIYRSIKRGVDRLTEIFGKPPICSAVPGWKCNDLVLIVKNDFNFIYNSDCRGETVFKPLVRNRQLPQPQIPVTLPTYDEVVGHNGITRENYNEYLFSLLRPGRLNVLTIHAEVEGIVCLDIFKKFLISARERGVSFAPLGNLLNETSLIDQAAIIHQEISGREGWVAHQRLKGTGNIVVKQ